MPPNTLRLPLGNVNRNVAGPPVPPQTLIMNAMMQAAMLDRQHQQQMQQQGPPVPSTLLNYGPGDQNAARTQYRPIPPTPPTIGPTLAMAPAPPMMRPGFNPLQQFAPLSGVPGQPGGEPLDANAAIAEMIGQGAIPPPTTQGGGPSLGGILGNALSQAFNQTTGAVGQGVGAFLQNPGVVGEPIGRGVEDLSANVLDKPRQWSANEQGEIVFQDLAWKHATTVDEAISYGLIPEGTDPRIAQELFDRGKSEHQLTQPGLGVDQNDEDLWKQILDAYQKGYTAYATVATQPGGKLGLGAKGDTGRKKVPVAQFDPGGRSVWELLQGRMNLWGRILPDLFYDPTVAGLGPVAKGGEAIRGAGEAMRSVEGASAVGKVAGRALEGVGGALKVPNAVLNELPDALIQTPIKTASELLQKIPVAGKLFQETTRTAARHGGNETDDMIRLWQGLSDQVPGTTNIGGMPEPGPGPGRLSEPPMAVTPEGEVLPNNPDYFAQGNVPSETPPPEPVIRTPTQKKAFVTGEDGKPRLATKEEQAAAGVYDQPIKTGQPEPTSPAFERPAPPSRAPKLLTPEERDLGMASGTVRPTDPVEGGTRIIDRAAMIAKQSPEKMPAYDQFLKDIEPDELHSSYRDWLEAPTTRFPTLEEKQARQVLDGIESVVYQTAPAFQTHFPGEPLDIPITEKRKAAATASGKASFQDENLRYLMQRVVYQDDRKALATIRGRFKGQDWVDELTQRLEAANEQYTKLREVGPEGIQTLGSGPIPPWVADAVKREATGEIPKRTPTTMNPNPEIPQQIRDVLDAPFTGQYDPELAGVRTEDVYKSNLLEVQRDQQLYQDFAAKGYKPENYKGDKPPKLTMREQRMRVKTGTTATANGKTRSTYRWQTTQVPSSEGNETMAALRQKYGKIGDIGDMTPQELARKKTARDRVLDLDPKEATKPNLLLDLIDGLLNRLPRNLILADPLTSWDYTMRNIIGNYSLSGIKGTTPAFPEMIRSGRRPNESVAADLEAELFGSKARGAPAAMAQEGSKLEDIGRSDTPARELGKKLHVDFPAKVFDAKKGIDHITERGHKIAMYATFYRDIVSDQIVKETDELSRYAAKRGIAVTQQEISDTLWSLRGPAGGFNQHDIYDAIHTMGTGAGLEDEAARNFARTASGSWNRRAIEGRAEAVFQANRVMPERRMTNLDRYASYLTLFHFWPTRSAKYLAEEMLRDPRLIHWWIMSHKGMQRAADEGNYPASVKGLIWIANSPFGFALYANPASLYLVTALQPDQPNYPDPQGMTELGHIIQEIKNKSGIGPTPWIDALLNITGVYGNTFLPNPLPSGTIDLAEKAMDVILTHSGHHMADPIRQNIMSKLRDWGSGLIPGTSDVPYVDQAGLRTDPISSMVLKQNPELEQRYRNPDTYPDAEAELAKIMSNEDDPKYIAAEKAVAYQGGMTELIRQISPISVKAKNLTRESIKEAAQLARETPYDQQTPQQQTDAAAWSGIMTPPEAMGPKAEQDQYAQVGTARQREIANNWNLLAFGDITELNKGGRPTFVRGTDGKLLPTYELVKMSADERKAVADYYLEHNNLTEDYGTVRDAQQAFKDTHPAYKGYSDFGKMARDYPGGVKPFREQLMRANPAYRQYIGRLPKDTRDNPRLLDKASISMDAYLAARGTKANIYAPNLSQDTEGWANTELLLNALGGSNSGTKKQYDLSTPEGKLASLKDKLVKYDSDMASYNAAAMKQTGGVAFDTLAPQFASVAENQLKNQGITKPSTPEIVAAFLLWRMTQPDPESATPEQYISWLTEYEKKAA